MNAQSGGSAKAVVAADGYLDLSKSSLTSEAADSPDFRLVDACCTAKKISFFDNSLSVVPEALRSSLHCVWLELCRNSLISPWIGSLKSLSNLMLQDNALESIPREIGELTGLVELRLDQNQLKTLPSTIGLLRSLRVLHLEGNPLVSLPEELGNCSELYDLMITGCDALVVLPASLCKCERLELLYAAPFAAENVSQDAFEAGAAFVKRELYDQHLLLTGAATRPPVAHLVFLELLPEADAAHLFSRLRGLKRLIPGLLSVSGGANTSTEGLSAGFTHSFSMHFVHAAARDAYLPHPAHEEVKALVLAAIKPGRVLVMDHDMPLLYFARAE